MFEILINFDIGLHEFPIEETFLAITVLDVENEIGGVNNMMCIGESQI
jgi:hypothetical protein